MDPQQKQEAKYKTKALMGIINDKMEVGMAKIRGEESAALDVAIIKATLQDEVVPKEKHVRTLKAACGATSPRQTVNYVIHGLTKRLEENPKAWLVTLKTLIVFHRLMRETDPSFQDELLRFAERTGHHRMLRLESFADHTTKETWDLSAWIRVYSLYLDERLSVFRTMRFDPEQDKGVEARDSKLKSCPANELLEHLPAVQKLLGRLVSCIPEGAAQTNEIALLACSLVRGGRLGVAGTLLRLRGPRAAGTGGRQRDAEGWAGGDSVVRQGMRGPFAARPAFQESLPYRRVCARAPGRLPLSTSRASPNPTTNPLDDSFPPAPVASAASPMPPCFKAPPHPQHSA